VGRKRPVATLRRVRIELDRVSRVFDGRPAVDALSLEIPAGALCVLLGPSGCGKSTTLRCVAGLESVDAGAIRFDGRVVNELDPAQRDVAMVFQNYALYPHLSVAENVAFPLRMRRVPRATREAKVTEVLRTLGLEELARRRPKELSGGQQQRVALARALVREPKVFLFDEPLSNLDARLRLELRAEIRSLHARLPATMLWVTHDQAEAMSLGDFVAVLDRGRLQQFGTPIEVFERPVNRFVAGFVGAPAMSFVRAPVSEGRVALLGHRFECRSSSPWLELGIRPHRLRFLGDGPLRATVHVHGHEPHGHETFVRVHAGDAELVAWHAGHVAPAVDEAAVVAFDPADLHAFDAEGRRVELNLAAGT
jgi:ABC-type sugar transport system ATPase subunit